MPMASRLCLSQIFFFLQTRLFVTNQNQHLKFANEIIVLENGRIPARGSFDKLKKSNNEAFCRFLETNLKDKESDVDTTDSTLDDDVSEHMKITTTANLETQRKRKRGRKRSVNFGISEVKSDMKHNVVASDILHVSLDVKVGKYLRRWERK